MTTINYERPREKMQQKGAAVLTNAELLQVIIGSGSAGMPVTKIARKVDKALRSAHGVVKVEDLITIPGLGIVKAGQIIASIELTTRLIYQKDAQEGEVTDVLEDLYMDIRSSKQPLLFYGLFNGSGHLIDDYSSKLNNAEDSVRIVRKLFAQALAQSTASIRIAIGHETQSLEPSLFELNLARDAYSVAALLSIPIQSFLLLNPTGEHSLKEVKHE